MSDKRLIQMIDVQDTKITDLQTLLQLNQDLIKHELCKLNRGEVITQNELLIQYELKAKLQICEWCDNYKEFGSYHYCYVMVKK
jgi:hypothetical protein